MPHEGYADPIMNDRPGFHSDIPVSELANGHVRVKSESVVRDGVVIALMWYSTAP